MEVSQQPPLLLCSPSYYLRHSSRAAEDFVRHHRQVAGSHQRQEGLDLLLLFRGRGSVIYLDVYYLHRAELDAISDTERKESRLAELHVMEGVRNLAKTMTIQVSPVAHAVVV